MKYLKIIFSFLIIVLLHTNVSGQDSKNEISLPLGGNAFSSLPLGESNTITDNGIENWTNPEEQFTVYFKVSKPGLVKIALNEAITIKGKSVLEFGINNTLDLTTLWQQDTDACRAAFAQFRVCLFT